MGKFSIGQSVIAKNKFKATNGKVVAIEKSKLGNNYIVDDGIYQTKFKECELTPFARTPFQPTDEEMRLIKKEFSFLKKGQVEIIFERNTMFIFKFSYSGQVGYGQFLGSTYKKLNAEAYNKWATYIG